MIMKNLYAIFMLILLTLTSCSSMQEKKVGYAATLKSKGEMCYNAGRYSEALEYLTKGLDQAKKENNQKMYNSCVGYIGNIYAQMGDYNRALYYFKRGFESSVKNHDNYLQSHFVINIVAAYCMMNDLKNAKAFFKLQTQIPTKDITNKKYYFLYNQGIIAQAENNMEMALYYHNAALKYAQEKNMGNEYVMGQYNELGGIDMKAGNTTEAISYFNLCLKMAQQMKSNKDIVKIYQCLSQAYAKAGNKTLAAKYKNLYLGLSDSIFNQDQFYIANSKLFAYENNENKQQIDNLVSRNNTQLAVIVVILLVMGGLAVFYMILRKKNRSLLDAQRMLVNKNEELMKNEQKNKDLLKQYVNAVNGNNGSNDEEALKEERTDIGLNEEQINRLLNNINNVMEDVTVISKSDFGLNTLAQLVDSNTKYVSWIINDVYGKNFKTFLNEYRIREACKRLSDDEHYGNVTIQAIYQELGYNSAAGFIQAFKKVTGMTPSTYHKLVVDKSEMMGESGE